MQGGEIGRLAHLPGPGDVSAVDQGGRFPHRLGELPFLGVGGRQVQPGAEELGVGRQGRRVPRTRLDPAPLPVEVPALAIQLVGLGTGHREQGRPGGGTGAGAGRRFLAAPPTAPGAAASRRHPDRAEIQIRAVVAQPVDGDAGHRHLLVLEQEQGRPLIGQRRRQRGAVRIGPDSGSVSGAVAAWSSRACTVGDWKAPWLNAPPCPNSGRRSSPGRPRQLSRARSNSPARSRSRSCPGSTGCNWMRTPARAASSANRWAACSPAGLPRACSSDSARG